VNLLSKNAMNLPFNPTMANDSPSFTLNTQLKLKIIVEK
jgi:hypothetical protein